MRRGHSLAWRMFLAILSVALLSVLVAAIVVRGAIADSFRDYLLRGPGPRQVGQMGRMILGAAEQAFLSSADRGLLVGALAAVALAAVGAVLLARYLSRPLARLTDAAQNIAEGDLAHRVDVQGPAEVERLGEAFNEMSESLQEAEELRRRLVADVAHELRNPVAALRAQAEGMSEGVLETSPERMGSLVEDVEHLSRLVEDLQELMVADAGRLAYEIDEVDLADLVGREASRAQATAPEGVTFAARCGLSDAHVEADDRRLSQVLRNILSNAARHTPSGEIEITCRAERAQVTVAVTDPGEGIPSDDLPYIFERFYRVDGSRSSVTGGSGIGLAIARRIVEDHGGEVFASSEVGRGTTVGFRIPRSAS